MRISVSTRHGHLASETQEKIGHKLEKLTRFHDKISSADVTVDLKEGGDPSVELCVAVDGTSKFVSHTHGSDLLGAVDGAVHKLLEQLRRHKEKVIDQHRVAGHRHFPEMKSQGNDEDFDIDEL